MLDTKECKKCLAVKPLDEFYRRKNGPKGRHSYCKECSIALGHHVYIHGQRIRSTYGMSPEYYMAMMTAQGGRCALCNKHQSEMSHRLCVDHDHQTGRIRGLLCHDCNRGIGLLGDDPDLLEKAVLYVRGDQNA